MQLLLWGSVASASKSFFEFDNGVRINRSHIIKVQASRYAENELVLHEPFEEEWFSALIFSAVKGSVFLDVGAAAGYYCLLALRLRPQLAVVAVNPNEYFRGALLNNAALQTPPVRVVQANAAELSQSSPVAGTILQIPVAVADEPGEVRG